MLKSKYKYINTGPRQDFFKLKKKTMFLILNILY
jgi:hypothetical protein